MLIVLLLISTYPLTDFDYFGLPGDMQAIDFLDKLLRYDHQDRLTAREAMVCYALLT